MFNFSDRSKLCLSIVLVKKKPNDMYFHIHIQAQLNIEPCTPCGENPYPTPKQTLKKVSKAKTSFTLKQTCRRIKTVFTT
jgi:hypothetical protein